MDKSIQKIIEVYSIPEHIKEHSLKVAAVAEFLAAQIKKNGHKVDKKAVSAAAKLHDLVRVCDIQKWPPKEIKATKKELKTWEYIRKKYKNIHHADAAYQILSELGFKKIAEIVKRHKFLSPSIKGEEPQTIEQKIVYYADKRVMHSSIVSLSQRFEDGEKRHALAASQTIKESEISKKAAYAIEKELTKLAGIKPSDINENTIS